MRQQQPSGPELTIDEPFDLDEADLIEEDLNWSAPPKPPTLIPGRFNTPGGNELVDPLWCEEPTLVMSADQSKELLQLVAEQVEEERLARHLLQGIHTRPTVRSMEAVSMPSSRPVPPVEVVEASGQWNT